MSPVIRSPTTCEPVSDASTRSVPSVRLIVAPKLTCSSRIGRSSRGSTALSAPSSEIVTGSGSWITRPASSSISVGVPQPIFTIGPNTYWPGAVGKTASISARIGAAWAIASSGNMIESSDPLRTASPSASSSSPRSMPTSPPTPLSVKPKPSWIPVNVAARLRNRDQRPGAPGICGLEDADRHQADAEHLELADAGVAADLGVEVEEAAAADHAGDVDAEAHPGGQNDAERDVEGAGVAGAEPKRELGSKPVDGERDRSERAGEGCHRLDRELRRRAAAEREREVHAVHPHAADGELGVEREREPCLGTEPDAGQARPRQPEWDVDPQLRVAEHRAQEAVQGAGAEHQPEALELGSERQLETVGAVVQAEREEHAPQLDPDPAGLAEQHLRRVEWDGQ